VEALWSVRCWGSHIFRYLAHRWRQGYPPYLLNGSIIKTINSHRVNLVRDSVAYILRFLHSYRILFIYLRHDLTLHLKQIKVMQCQITREFLYQCPGNLAQTITLLSAFVRYPLRISAQIPTILTEVFWGIPQPTQICDVLDHNCFLIYISNS
jgi:hypothetical protein